MERRGGEGLPILAQAQCHFCSNGALLTRVPKLISFLLLPDKTTCNGSQGMEFCRHASRLVRGQSHESVADGRMSHRLVVGREEESVPDQQILHQRRSAVWKQL